MVPNAAPALDHAGVEAARLVRAGREQLVSEHPSVTYALLAEGRAQTEVAARQWVRRLRSSGRMVTVEWDGLTLIPSFQFDEAYEPISEVGAAVAQLVGRGLSGWAVWRWFVTVNPWIGERPVALVSGRRFGQLRDAVEGFVADNGE